LCEALQRHRAAGGLADQAFQLIAPVRRDLGVGMQGKPLHAGTAGTRERGRLALAAKARAEAPDLLASSLPKGDALLHRGRQGPGEFGRVITQGGIACGRSRGRARLQVSQPTPHADDPPADLLDHGGDVRVGRWLTLHKTWLKVLVTAIAIHSLKKHAMISERSCGRGERMTTMLGAHRKNVDVPHAPGAGVRGSAHGFHGVPCPQPRGGACG
jgi:hypothetical protein